MSSGTNRTTEEDKTAIRGGNSSRKRGGGRGRTRRDNKKRFASVEMQSTGRSLSLNDQVDIPMDSVSCSLQNEFGVFRLVSIALPYSRAHGSRPFLSYYARDFTRAVNLYAHVYITDSAFFSSV